MAIKRKMSFAHYIKMEMPNHNAQAYAKDVKLTGAEKKILVEYLNGHAALQVLTAPMLMKMLRASNTKLQFKNAYSLELIAINLGEHDRDTLLKMFKESTLKKWLTESSIMSRPMQEIYLEHFGYTVFEGSQLPTVQGAIDTTGRVHAGKPRTAKEAAEDTSNMRLLRDSVSDVKPKVEAVQPVPTAPDAMNYREQQQRHKEEADDGAVHCVADYFSAHVMGRIGESLQEMYDDMMNYHHDSNVPYLFKEFARSPLSQLMADFWWESFVFEYVEYKDDDNTLKLSCKHFIVYISHNDLTFVDLWDCGEITYTIPASDKQEARLAQVEYFFQTWASSRVNEILQHIGFGQDDELVACGKPISLKSVASGPQALMEMDVRIKPVAWDGGEYTVYETLEHMRDGIRGASWVESIEAESCLCIGGIEYAAVIASDGPVRRYVMTNIDAKAFFKEYTDHMGWHEGAHELRKHGFMLTLDKTCAVLSFNDDHERPCEVIAYV